MRVFVWFWFVVGIIQIIGRLMWLTGTIPMRTAKDEAFNLFVDVLLTIWAAVLVFGV